MRHFILIGCGLIMATASVAAAEPTGEWLVENKGAVIRIENCGGTLWGIVAWEKTPGRDIENPDPAKRSRPTLGIPILIDMKPAGPQRWEGEVYNAQNGKTYSANITQSNPNALRIEGCLIGGFLCGGQEWTRVENSSASALPAPSQMGPKSGAQKPAPQAKAAPQGKAVALSDVCSRVSDLAGPSH